ncbi:MAG: ATP-dependent DNA helicase [Clostridia bacterium]|nr:ATP-dependent DNA helicase [Clostridia bacterium]
MSAIYDRLENTVFINAREACEFVFRGGSIDRSFVPGNKNGGAIVSQIPHGEKPNIVDAYTFTTIKNGTKITVYTYPEWVRSKDKDIYINLVETLPYQLDSLANGELDIATKTAMLSGYIVSESYKLHSINMVLSFYSEGTDQSIEYEQKMTRQDLAIFFEGLIDELYPYLEIVKEKSTSTLVELSSLRFPFKQGARDGQRELIIEAFRAIRGGKRLVAEAPTGTGKTLGALYPALKSLGEGYADKIFYFTGKTTTALSAINAIELLRDQIPSLRAIHISAKDKCCVSFKPNTLKKCDPKSCLVTRGYFDKINVAILELLTNYKTYTKDIIDQVAEKYSLCSYELSLELSEWCEVVVCDYNYLFDLQAYFRRYFECPTGARYIFLVDEAHNLPDRAREMYSVTMEKSEFDEIAKRYSGNKHLGAPCVEVLNKFQELYELAMAEKMDLDGVKCGFYINNDLPDGLVDPFAKFVFGAKAVLKKNLDDELLHKLYIDSRKLLATSDIFDKRFTMYVEVIDTSVKLRLLCLDPSHLINLRMKLGKSTILFSATLTPLEYFSDVLGCEKTNTLSLKSPFDKKNLCLIGAGTVSTRYEDREKSAKTIANIIRATIEGKAGNYIVYFPSYKYLTEVKEVFQKKYPKINITTQSRSMSEKAKQEFLDSFDAKAEGTLVGFCVMGGSFSEGIDLRGERLIGAIVVGVGLPTISNELNIIKEHFDKTRETGYAYAYTYPGMIKVLQASGRVIRSEDEKGVVLLIDDRFTAPEYRALMPEYWSHIKFISSAQELLSTVVNFWKNDGENSTKTQCNVIEDGTKG